MDKTKMAVAVFDKHAKLYQEKYMDVSLYHDTFDLFCSHLPQQAHILDLACGPGNISRYLLDSRPDFKILGTDLSPNMISLAKANNPEARFEIMDCRDISSLGQKFNGIVGGFCLPYLSKEEALKLIKDASDALEPQGILYISTMEDDYGKSGVQKSSTGDEVYMYYHEAAYLLKAFEDNRLSIIDTSRKTYPDGKGGTVTDLIIIGKKA